MMPMERDINESRRVLRGCFYGVLFSTVAWALIALFIWWISI